MRVCRFLSAFLKPSHRLLTLTTTAYRAQQASSDKSTLGDEDSAANGNLAGRVGYSFMSGQNQAIEALTPTGTSTEDAIFTFQQLSLSSSDRGRRKLPPRLQSKYDRCVACLPPTAVIEALVDSFCSEVNWYMGILERPYFEAQLQAWLRDNDQNQEVFVSPDAVTVASSLDARGLLVDTLYFPAALFQVLAISLQFLPFQDPVRQSFKMPSLSDSDKLSRLYSDFGVELTTLLGRHESSSTAVLADLLRCGWLKNVGRGDEAWFSLSDAVR